MNNILPISTTKIIMEGILSDSYKITLKIKQSGLHKIFSRGGSEICGDPINEPNSIVINNEVTITEFIEPLPYVYNFEKEDNTIILVWNSKIESCSCLFYGCHNITEINLSEFDVSNVNSFRGMFMDCFSLISINFLNFQTTNATDMAYMFNGCGNLSFLDISSFDTSLVYNMDRFFKGCSSLTSLALSHLNTEKVIWMAEMFMDCSSLTELDLSKFVTLEVRHFYGMFNGCTSLVSLNLSNFYTPNAESLQHMFSRCHSLKYLDISNFNTENGKGMEGMFHECYSLLSLNVSHFNTKQVVNMRIMFGFCRSLSSLDLSHFNTENVYDMGWMFVEMMNLKSLDLSSFKTSSVNVTDYMFAGLFKLKSLDVNNLDTSKVVNMDHMFHHCISLTSLDLHNFDTSLVTTMFDMFSHCYELTSINLESFNTSSVRIMQGMFSNTKLYSLNLNHFDTSKVINMSYMFYSCSNLKTLQIDNFDTSNVETMEYMFCGCFKLESLEISIFSTSKVVTMDGMFIRILSINSLNLSSFDTSLVTSFYFMFEDCQFNFLNLSNFKTSNVVNMSHMFNRCDKLISADLSNFYTSNVENMEYMFAGCNNLKYIDLKQMTFQVNTLITQIIEKNLKNTIICMDDLPSFLKMISLYDWSHVNCEGNWGEKIDKISERENNICQNNSLISKYDSRCYQICSIYFYFDDDKNQYLCTEECPKSHIKLIHGKNECVKSCEETKDSKLEFNNICLKECPENFIALEDSNSCSAICPKEKPFILLDTLICSPYCTITQRQNNLCIANYIPRKEDNFNILDKVIEQTRYELLNNFDASVVNGKSINEEGAKIIIKRTNDKKDNENYIDLSECEEMLKVHYNITPNESLYLFIIEIEQEGMAAPSFEYELLYPIDSPNLQKLNLTICKDVRVKIDIPFNLTDDLEKYNSSSPYYNDICYVIDSEDSTDISLSDRKQDYVNKNMSICEGGCDFISYNMETQKAFCSCGIKTDIPFLDNVKIDKSLLMDSFIDISNIANTKMMTCYNTVFQKKSVLKNMGCFIFGILIFLNLLCFFLFLLKYYKKLLQRIEKIKLIIIKNIIHRNNMTLRTKNKYKNKRSNNTPNMMKSSERKIKDNKNKILFNKKTKKIKSKITSNKHFPPKNKKSYNIRKMSLNDDNNKSLSLSKKTITQNNKNTKIKKLNLTLFKNQKNKTIMKSSQNKLDLKLTNSEINSLSYVEAILKDKRKFLEIYFSFIRVNHLLLFVFNNEDYNSQMIKLSIIFFNIAIYIAVNSLFFNDSTMHKIYTNHGSYNFVYQLPQIIYSMLISAVLNGIIKRLGLTEKNILTFKTMNFVVNNVEQSYKKLIRVIKIKFILFYLIVFSFLFMFWYYVTSFCGIYRNTQLHLIKDSLCSFATSLITPFGIYLLPGFFRIQALKRKSKYLYGFSQILQIL